MEFIIEGFIYVWIAIIAIIPGFMMTGLTMCILGTAITYLEKRGSSDAP
ncbi:MAG: hypothetical protein IIA41_07755 [SAR324 cluster bacterium]|nr:hypothetical protein [SAR324 cluster bacterium]